MSIENFIPELWASAILDPYLKSLVFGQPTVVNTDYEGQISQQGDTVHVTTIGYPTIGSYDKTTDITIEDLSDTGQELVIDQGDYFGFRVNDVDKVQAAGNFQSDAMGLAAYGLKNTVDQYIAGLFTGAQTANKLGNVSVFDGDPKDISGTDISAYQVLVKLDEALDKANVPTEGRYVVVSPAFRAALQMDQRFTSAAHSGTTETLRNGNIGQAANFEVLVSNNLAKVGGRDLISAGVPGAISFASQINSVEALREQKRFADIVRGLNIYGAKLFRPEGIATAQVAIHSTFSAS
ncbi:P22 phage major capsid protein family protein [Gryllotalpicola koreensis]|uniref:P22 phage major capsid protein family protein n=1 Tax=Gryllotalpicola koreensis TaxID=993086 RepID=A0ABP8A1Q6_9MICO